jgi:hypothetical protein
MAKRPRNVSCVGGKIAHQKGIRQLGRMSAPGAPYALHFTTESLSENVLHGTKREAHTSPS